MASSRKGSAAKQPGCFPCRVRKKRCFMTDGQTGSCQDCRRLGYPCEGFGVKMPHWTTSTNKEFVDNYKIWLSKHRSTASSSHGPDERSYTECSSPIFCTSPTFIPAFPILGTEEESTSLASHNSAHIEQQGAVHWQVVDSTNPPSEVPSYGMDHSRDMEAHPVEQSSASMPMYPNSDNPQEMCHRRTPIGDPSVLQSLDQGASFSSPVWDGADPSGADINGTFQAPYIQGDHQPSIAFGTQEGGMSTLYQYAVDYFTRAMTVTYLELFLFRKPTDQQITLMIDLTRAAVINELQE